MSRNKRYQGVLAVGLMLGAAAAGIACRNVVDDQTAQMTRVDRQQAHTPERRPRRPVPSSVPGS